MKKRDYFLILMLLSIVFSTSAQQLKADDLLNIKKIESVVNLEKHQKEQIVKALESRQNSNLENAEDNNYLKRLYEILTDAQSKKIIEAQIDYKDIKNEVAAFYNLKVNPKGFPKHYKEGFRDVLKKYQYNITYANIKYSYNEVLKEQEINSISQERTVWFSEHNNALKQANKLWRILTRQHPNLQASLKEDFVNYHLYAYFKKNKETLPPDTDKNLDKLTRSEVFKKLINSIVDSSTEKILSRLKLKIKDSTVHSNAKKELDSVYFKALETKITLSENLTEPYAVSPAIINIPEFIQAKQAGVKQAQKKNTLNTLAEKAKQAGLEDARVKQFIALIEKKEKDMAAHRASRTDNGKTASSVLEIGPQKTIGEIKKEFSRDIAAIVSKKEFAEILVDELKPIATKKAKQEMKEVMASYKLTKEQRIPVYKRIALYYLNEAIAKAYYTYDKRLLKQKLSGLRYYFEKDYKAMMDGFDIKIDSSKKAKKNTYQY